MAAKLDSCNRRKPKKGNHHCYCYRAETDMTYNNIPSMFFIHFNIYIINSVCLSIINWGIPIPFIMRIISSSCINTTWPDITILIIVTACYCHLFRNCTVKIHPISTSTPLCHRIIKAIWNYKFCNIYTIILCKSYCSFFCNEFRKFFQRFYIRFIYSYCIFRIRRYCHTHTTFIGLHIVYSILNIIKGGTAS